LVPLQSLEQAKPHGAQVADDALDPALVGVRLDVPQVEDKEALGLCPIRLLVRLGTLPCHPRSPDRLNQPSRFQARNWSTRSASRVSNSSGGSLFCVLPLRMRSTG